MKKMKFFITFGLAGLLICYGCGGNPEGRVTMDVNDYLHEELGINIVQGKIDDPYISYSSAVEEIGAKIYVLEGTISHGMIVVEDVIYNKFYIDQSIGGYEFYKPYYYVEDSIDNKAATLLIENAYQMPVNAFESFFNNRYQDSIFTYHTGRLLFNAYFHAKNNQTQYDSVKMINIRNRILEKNIKFFENKSEAVEYIRYMHKKFLEIDLLSEACHYLYCFDLGYSLYVVAVFPVAYTNTMGKQDKNRYRYVIEMIRI